MLWHIRSEPLDNENGQATDRRGNKPPVERLAALTARRFGPEASAA
jgi:hypothetical protein